MNNKMIIILMFILSFFFTGEIYIVYIDREFGFWGVRSNDHNHTINYTGKTLSIKTGDTVIWENVDNAGDRVTIMSDNLLWEGGKSLGRLGDIFRFTFNGSGYYRFHLAEQNRVTLNASNQPNYTTTYNEEDDSYETTNTGGEEVTIKYFLPRYQIIEVSGPTIGNGTYPITYKRNQNQSNVTVPSTAIISKTEIKPIGWTQTKVATPTPTPKATNTPIPKLESYQEFTLYEILKKWYSIIQGDNVKEELGKRI